MSKRTDPRVVWGLSRGDYSDYRFLCVVEGGESEAKQLAARANAQQGEYGEEFRVESLLVVPPDVERVEILNLTAEIRDNGKVEERDPHYRVEWPFDALFPEHAGPVYWRWVRAPIHNNKGGRLDVCGTDHERVRRVYSDRKAMLLADDAFRMKKEATGRR